MSLFKAVKQTVSRRNFLGAAPAAVVSAPIAARQIMSQSDLFTSQAPVGDGVRLGAGSTLPGSPIDPWELAQQETMRAYASGRVPEWKNAELRISARRRARWLDADIMTMRSISDSARYRMQEDREFKRQIDEMVAYDQERTMWKALVDRFTPRIPFRSSLP